MGLGAPVPVAAGTVELPATGMLPDGATGTTGAGEETGAALDTGAAEDAGAEDTGAELAGALLGAETGAAEVVGAAGALVAGLCRSSARGPRQLQMQWVPSGAVHDGGRGNRLGHGARAVGDGQGGGLESKTLAGSSDYGALRLLMCSYLSDGVGAGAVGDLSGSRAVGGVGSDNLGGVDGAAVVIGGGTGHEGSRGSDD